MNLEQFRYMKEVVRCRSISKAAKQLYLTQPTISNAIHNFEEEVGYKVFRRSNQGVELTEDGEKVMESIDIILHELDNIRNTKEKDAYMTGDVYIEVSPTICSTIMPQIIIACKQKYPGITVHVKEVRDDKSISSLMAGSSSIGLTSFVGLNELEDLQPSLGVRHFEREHLLTEPFMLYTGRDNPLASEKEVEVDEAYAYSWIIQEERNYEENCMLFGQDEVCPNGIIAFEDKDSVKQAIAANLGVAVMGSSFAGEDDPYVTSGLIHRVALNDISLNVMHTLVTPRKRRFTAVENCFLEELRSFYRKLREKQKEQLK